MTQSDVQQIIVAFERRITELRAEFRVQMAELAVRVEGLTHDNTFADGVAKGRKDAEAEKRRGWTRFDSWVVPILASTVTALLAYILNHHHSG